MQLNLSVPAGVDCLSFDTVFASEEFPEFIGSEFNDGFIAELDQSTWMLNGSTPVAPNDFALDQNGTVISVNSSFSSNATSDTGLQYDGATQQLTARTPITPGSHKLFLSIYDAGDHIYDSAAFIGGLRTYEAASNSACTSTATYGDSDGDGIPDSWEINGVTVFPFGITEPGNAAFSIGPIHVGTFINLPAMGADPHHKDLFVHADNMGAPFAPNPAALQLVTNAFNNAPLSNPDGTSGVHLHIDAGPNSIMNPVTGAKWGALSDAGAIPHTSPTGLSSLSSLESYRYAPSGRSSIFRYACFCDQQAGSSSSGITDSIPGNAFLVTLGLWNPSGGTIYEQAGTLMHELGHSLGLGHGGFENTNYKPNYLSIMNYLYQISGLPKTDGTFTYDYSRDALPALDESQLNESVGVGGGSYYAFFKGSGNPCPDGKDVYRELSPPAIDWNGNCKLDSGNESVDLGAKDASGNSVTGTLNGSLDWQTGTTQGTIQFAADGIGVPAPGEPTTTGAPESEDTESQLLAPIPPEVLSTENSSPIPLLAADRQSGLGPLSVNFDATGSSPALAPIATYHWDFGDGTTATTSIPSVMHTFATTGEYVAALTVTDSLGHSSAINSTLPISVKATNELPVPIIQEPVTSGETPLAITLDGSDSFDPDGSITSYSWSFGDGTSGSGSVANHTYTAPGTYTPNLTVQDDDGATASIQGAPLTITSVPNLPPVSAFTSDQTEGASPLTVHFDASSSYDPDGSIDHYLWDFGDGTEGLGLTPFHTYSSPGHFVPKLTVVDNGGASTTFTGAAITVTNGAQTASTLSLSSTPNPSVSGQAVTLTATVTPTDGGGSIGFFADGSATALPGCDFQTLALVSSDSYSATCLVSSLALGTHALSATYTGDAAFTSSSTELKPQQTVTQASTELTLGTSPSKPLFGQPVSVTATLAAISPGAGSPTGVIMFSIGGSVINGCGSQPVGQAGQVTDATCTLHGLQPGSQTITAMYAGDTSFTESSGSGTVTVGFTKPCISTLKSGPITIKSGESDCISKGATIFGSINIQPGGALSITDATVIGQIVAQGGSAFTLCHSATGPVAIRGASGYVLVGNDSDNSFTCQKDLIVGGLTLSNNAGGLEIGDNGIIGPVFLFGNSGSGLLTEDASPEIEGNEILGSLGCASNVGLTNNGVANFVIGQRLGQCAAF